MFCYMSNNECNNDFLSCLPPELVVNLFRYLSLDDVLGFSLVSRRWYRLVCGLEEYFRDACTTFGLSSTTVSRERWRYASYRELVIVARRQRRSLNAVPPSSIPLTSDRLIAKEHNYQSNTSYGNLVARTIYSDFIPVQTVIERVTSDALTQLKVFPASPGATAADRVKWACMDTDFLLCATACGMWSGYSLTASPRAALRYRCRMDPLYSSIIGGCNKCFLVLVGNVDHPRFKEEPTALRLQLNAIAFGRELTHPPNTSKWNLTPKTQASQLVIENGKKCIYVLPWNSGSPGNQGGGGFCKSHLILHQLVDTVTSYMLTLDPPALSVHHPLHVPVFEVCKGGKTMDFELVVSCDKSFMAFLCAHRLQVFDVQSGVLQSAASIDIGDLRHKNMRLLAVGHVYSLIGLEPYDTLLVVSTHTGAIVAKYCNFAVYSGPGPNRIEFLCVIDTLWLDDISRLCCKDLPTVMYWNGSTSCTMGLRFGHDERQTPPTSCPQSVKTKRNWLRRRKQ